MRVIWLRKKLVEYKPSVIEEGLVLHHGTNLPNLYRIIESGRLGSEVGRHGGAYERVGTFYMTESPDWAFRYARDAAKDLYYYLPEDEVPYIEEVADEITPDIEKLKEIFGAEDLLDLYIAFASFMRYHGFLDPDVYPPVVITIAVTDPQVLNKIYFDEDDFRDWLRTQDTTYIVEVAKRDPEFYKWLSELTDNPEGITRADDISEYAVKEVEEAFYETFPYEEEISESQISNAAFHLTAKQIYQALIRLAEHGDQDARNILAQVKDSVTSFFLTEPISFDEADLVIATIYTKTKPIEIDLKDPAALDQVEEIMKEQILRWARIVTS
jgi:hypothetical protein